jgi:hypothetical protein
MAATGASSGLIPGVGVPAPTRNRLRRKAALSDFENAAIRKGYGGGAAAQPDADGGTACLACIARTGAPRGAAPPHSVTIQACSYMYKS